MTERIGARPPIGEPADKSWAQRDRLLHKLTVAVAIEDLDDYEAAYDALIKFEKDAGEFDDYDYCTECDGSGDVFDDSGIVPCECCGGTGSRDDQVEIEARREQAAAGHQVDSKDCRVIRAHIEGSLQRPGV